MNHSSKAVAILACALAPACAVDDAPDPMTEPTAVLAAPWGSLDASSEVVAEGPLDFAAALPAHALLVGHGDELHRVDPLVDVPVLVGEDLAMPSAVAGIDDSTAVLAGPDGLFVLENDALRSSPLNDLLVDWEVTAMLAVPRGDSIDLWMASPEGLRLHRDGVLHDIAVGDLATAGAQLAWGPTVDGVPSLWVAAGSDLYSITASGDALTALPVLDGPTAPVEHLVADAAGRLWAAGGGEFFRRLGSETWDELVTTAPVIGLYGRPDDSDVYIVTDELMVAQGEGFYSLSGLPEGDIAGVDPLGRLLILGPDALHRASPRRPVGFLGLQPGDQLGDIEVLQVLPSLSAHVTGISAMLDEAALTLADDHSVVLDPLELADGPHSIEYTIAYDDADPVVVPFLFSVGEFVPPTWQGDIEPLFVAECAECHTDAGVSRPLDTPASWQADFDLILYNLQEARMPLPPRDPLGLSDIQLVRAWAAGGFPE